MAEIRVGTAGWTDKTLIESGWYPDGASNPEAPAVLRESVPAGRGGLRVLRTACRADCHRVGGTDPRELHLQR